MARFTPFAIVSIALSTLWIGCGPSSAAPPAEEPGQSYAAALRLMCEVDQHATLDPEEDPIGIEGSRLDWMRDHITNPDAIELITLLRVRSNAEKAKMLRQQTNAEKMTSCALARSWAASPG